METGREYVIPLQQDKKQYIKIYKRTKKKRIKKKALKFIPMFHLRMEIEKYIKLDIKNCKIHINGREISNENT